jgi:hypothetical protein
MKHIILFFIENILLGKSVKLAIKIGTKSFFLWLILLEILFVSNPNGDECVKHSSKG